MVHSRVTFSHIIYVNVRSSTFTAQTYRHLHLSLEREKCSINPVCKRCVSKCKYNTLAIIPLICLLQCSKVRSHGKFVWINTAWHISYNCPHIENSEKKKNRWGSIKCWEYYFIIAPISFFINIPHTLEMYVSVY